MNHVACRYLRNIKSCLGYKKSVRAGNICNPRRNGRTMATINWITLHHTCYCIEDCSDSLLPHGFRSDIIIKPKRHVIEDVCTGERHFIPGPLPVPPLGIGRQSRAWNQHNYVGGRCVCRPRDTRRSTQRDNGLYVTISGFCSVLCITISL